MGNTDIQTYIRQIRWAKIGSSKGGEGQRGKWAKRVKRVARVIINLASNMYIKLHMNL
jgi:hypothetical protein